MIPFEEYIWGEKFIRAFESKLCYTKIDNYTGCPKESKYVMTLMGDASVTAEKVSHYPNLVYWFGTNVFVDDKRVIPIPVGLPNDYITEHNKYTIYEYSLKQDIKPEKLLYLNFATVVYPSEREAAYNYFGDKNYATCKNRIPNEEYYTDVLKHHFVLCPRGAGLDCHRTFDTFYLGRYPLMKRYYGLEKLYEDLPVLFVDEWDQVNEDFLNEKLEEMKNKTYNMDKLKFSWWENKINEMIK